ncbi:ribonuclease P protein component [Bauldia litoralis]|uniref:ribonuclease P protein component n=1 Tax=Bauldia litoralis TaxID=665467 RepID=UPI000A932C62|nr:ribonuclease P protein component [Bauldia litoralis]
MDRLKRRSEFRAVGRGRRISRPGFVLQALRATETGREPRFGFTVTKKIGNAVVRNRIRRRLREVVRLSAAGGASESTDYVLIGRRAALRLPFDRLVDDLSSGMAALSQNEAAGGGSGA